jgi:hypothetical protein
MPSKVQCEIVYNTEMMGKVSKLMSGLDLGIDKIDCPVCYLYTWNTKTKVDGKYLAMMQSKILKFHEDLGNEVLSIKIEKL